MVGKEYLEKFKDFLDSDTKEAKITKVALVSIALASLPFITAGAVAMGNGVQIFRMFDKKKQYTNRQITDAMGNIKRQKMIEYISDKNGITTVKITKKGESVLKRFAIDLIKINQSKKWDGKWRLVMFDLPISYSKARNSLRFKLKQLGFIQLQKSAWIYPYPCEYEILFISDYFKVGKYVEFLQISGLKNDDKLKKYFKLV